MTRIPSGSTDRYIYFVGVDATDLKTRETGLSGWVVYASLNGGAAGTFTTPTVNETDSTNMPGVYELLLDEYTSLTAGNDTEELCLHITDGSSLMAPVTRVIEIYRPETTEGNTLGVASDGHISGDVDGNVVGSVASVSGAVGSVTGAVGSVTAGVTVSGTITTLDALDTALDSAHGAGSWATAVGFSTHAAADVWSVVTRELSGTIGDFDALDTALDAAHGAGSWASAVGFSTHAAADVWSVVTRELSGTIGDFDALDTALDAAHGAGSWATAVGFSTFDASATPVELLDSGGTAGTSAAELVVDIFATALTELSAAPGTTPTLDEAMMLLYQALRNRLDIDTTSTDYLKIYNNAGTCVAKKAVTDDGTIYSEAQLQNGP